MRSGSAAGLWGWGSKGMGDLKFPCVCIFCGQSIIVDDGVSFATVDEADKWAAEHCKCDDARAARDKAKVMDNVKGEIDLLFGREHDCFSAELRKFLLDGANLVIDGVFDSIQVNLGYGTKASIKPSVKNVLNITRTDLRTTTREV